MEHLFQHPRMGALFLVEIVLVINGMRRCKGQQFEKLVLVSLKAPFENIVGIAGGMIAKAFRQFGQPCDGKAVLWRFMLASSDLLVSTISRQVSSRDWARTVCNRRA